MFTVPPPPPLLLEGSLYTGYNTNEKFPATGCLEDVDGAVTEGFGEIKVYLTSATSEWIVAPKRLTELKWVNIIRKRRQ